MILALDQAMVTSGFSIFNDDLVSYGKFTIDSSLPLGERLKEIIDNLNKINDNFSIHQVYFEDIQNQRNQQTYKKLAYCQAIIILWCQYNNISYDILSPSHWRSLIKEKYGVSFGRKREEQKDAAIAFIKEQFNETVSSDEADAICIGVAGLIEDKKNSSAF